MVNKGKSENVTCNRPELRVFRGIWEIVMSNILFRLDKTNSNSRLQIPNTKLENPKSNSNNPTPGSNIRFSRTPLLHTVTLCLKSLGLARQFFHRRSPYLFFSSYSIKSICFSLCPGCVIINIRLVEGAIFQI